MVLARLGTIQALAQVVAVVVAWKIKLSILLHLTRGAGGSRINTALCVFDTGHWTFRKQNISILGI